MFEWCEFLLTLQDPTDSPRNDDFEKEHVYNYIYIKPFLIFGVPLDTLSDFGRAISTPLPGDSISGTVGAYEKATIWPGRWPLGC